MYINKYIRNVLIVYVKGMVVIVAIDFNVIGKRLKEIRKQKGLTQEQLVEKMGVSIAYLSKIETGKVHINLERLSQICEILNVSEGKILNGTSNSSELYLNSEFNVLLRKCSPKQLKLAYKILRFYFGRGYLTMGTETFEANLKPI